MPNVLITGAGRRTGIAAACALTLARAGWDVGLSCWRLYDRGTGPPSADREPLNRISSHLAGSGLRGAFEHDEFAVQVDLGEPAKRDLQPTLSIQLAFGHAWHLEHPIRCVLRADFRKLPLQGVQLPGAQYDPVRLQNCDQMREVTAIGWEPLKRIDGRL